MSANLWEPLAWTLLHSLWQAGAMGILLWLVLRRIPAHRTEARYGLAIAGLVVVLVGAMVTLAMLSLPSPDSGAAGVQISPTVSVQTNDQLDASSTDARSEPAAVSLPPSAVPRPALFSLKDATTPSQLASWEALVVWLWLAGVLGMLGRSLGALRGARRLADQAQTCNNEALLELTQSLSRSLGLVRRVAVRAHPHLRVPAVVGLVRPVILLPAAAMTGMTTQQLEAVLLHELAHIRRHDLLVQIGQMLIEAVLFFNPAVWWISRQVRIEREACADRAAARVLGEPDRYVQVLADWAQRLRSSGAAEESTDLAGAGLGFAGRERDHSLLERARRLLVPGYQPRVKLPWSTVGVLLLVSGLLLTGFWQGATLAVQAAAKALSPQERMEAIEQVRQTHGEPAQQEADPRDPANHVTITGTIRLADGSPVPEDLRLNAQASWDGPQGSGTAAYDVNHEGGRFEFTRLRPADAYFLRTSHPDYAPGLIGPLKAQPGGRIEDVEVVVSAGFNTTLRILNSQGQPIAGAAVKHSYIFHPRPSTTHYLPSAGPRVTDAQGQIALSHASGRPLQVDARAAGHQFDRFEVTPTTNSVHELPLRAATPAVGTIVDRTTGEPISGAEIRLVRRTGHFAAGNSPYETAYQTLLATSDAQGRFTLDTLRDEAFYTLRVDAPDHGPELFYDIHAGQSGLVWQMGPPRVLHGRITAELDQLDRRRGQPRIWYSMSVEIEKDNSFGSHFSVPVRIEQTDAGEVGIFETHNLLPGSLTISAVTPPVRTDTRAMPAQPIELDLRKPEEQDNPPAMREVVFRVVVPEGMPQAQGTLRLDYLETPDARGYKPVENVPLKDGVVRYSVPVPTKVMGRGQNVPGYWVPSTEGVSVPEGEEPFTIELQAIPAGAVYGRVFDADGSPTSHMNLSLVNIEQPSLPKGVRATINDMRVEGPNEEGRFVAGPLPLGGVYRLVASSSEIANEARVISEPLRLDEATPLHEIELRFAPGVTVTGTIVDEQGEPLVGVPVSLHYATPWSHGFDGVDRPTDSQGRFHFEHVNPDLPGKHQLIISPSARFQGKVVEFAPSDKPMRIELVPGRRLEGTVIDVATGKPMAGVPIDAWPWGHQPGQSSQSVKTRTDAQGHFTFDNLGDREYMLRVDSTWPEGTSTFQRDGRTRYRSPTGNVNHFRPQEQPVEVRVTTHPSAGS